MSFKCMLVSYGPEQGKVDLVMAIWIVDLVVAIWIVDLGLVWTHQDS